MTNTSAVYCNVLQTSMENGGCVKKQKNKKEIQCITVGRRWLKQMAMLSKLTINSINLNFNVHTWIY